VTMRLSRTDLLPIAVILTGGVAATLASATFVLRRADPVRPEVAPTEVAIQRPSAPAVVDRGSLDGLALVPVGAIERVESLLANQGRIVREVSALPLEREERRRRAEPLRARKELMFHSLAGLEREMDRFVSGGAPEGLEAGLGRSRASDLIRDSKLKEKVIYSRGTIEEWDPESAVTLEATIESDLRALLEQMERAPLVYVDGTRVEMDGLASVMWGRFVIGETRMIPASLLAETIDRWRDASGTPESVARRFEGLEVVDGEAAVATYGRRGAGGVVLISLGSPEPRR